MNQVTVRMKLAREQEGSCDNLEPHEQDHCEQEEADVDAYIYKNYTQFGSSIALGKNPIWEISWCTFCPQSGIHIEILRYRNSDNELVQTNDVNHTSHTSQKGI